jgi:hypothetical protein
VVPREKRTRPSGTDALDLFCGTNFFDLKNKGEKQNA